MKKLPVQMIWSDRKRILGMPISFTKYSLSEDRIFLQTGFFNVKFEELLLYRVQDLTLTMNLGQRIFGVGTVTLHSSDRTTSHLELKNVKHPMEVKELIHNQVEAMKDARRMRLGELIDGDMDDEGDCEDCE
ncbi:MAG: PH domain-containing protein [Oscillospiraceae bacterium]|nr:PH domain-containing protein [Oscillospiraceae bacterium]